MDVLKEDMYRVGVIEEDAKNMVRSGANEQLWFQSFGLVEFTIQVDLWGQLNAVALASLHTQQLILCDEKERKHHAVPGGFRKLLFLGLEKIRKLVCMQNKSYYS